MFHGQHLLAAVQAATVLHVRRRWLRGALRGGTLWLRMSCCSLNMTRCRVGSGVRRQAGNASLAACTAAWNSAGVVSGQRDTTSCVAWQCSTTAFEHRRPVKNASCSER